MAQRLDDYIDVYSSLDDDVKHDVILSIKNGKDEYNKIITTVCIIDHFILHVIDMIGRFNVPYLIRHRYKTEFNFEFLVPLFEFGLQKYGFIDNKIRNSAGISELEYKVLYINKAQREACNIRFFTNGNTNHIINYVADILITDKTFIRWSNNAYNIIDFSPYRIQTDHELYE